MRGHNVGFYGQIRKITPNLSQLPLLIWSTVIFIIETSCSWKFTKTGNETFQYYRYICYVGKLLCI